MLRRPSVATVVILVLAVTLSGCFGGPSSGSQPGTLPGAVTLHGTVVTDGEDMTPIASATVSVGDIATETDSEGRFALTDVPVHHEVITVTFTAPGYESKSVDVIVGGGSVVLHVSLLPTEEQPGGNDDEGNGGVSDPGGQLPGSGDEEPGSGQDGTDPGDEQEPARPEYDTSVEVSVRLRNTSTPLAGAAALPSTDVEPVHSPAAVRRTAAETYVPGEWIVEVDAGQSVQPISVAWNDAGIVTVEQLADNYYLVVSDGELSDDEMEERLMSMPNVVSVGRNQKVYPVSLAVTPNDTYFDRQWSLPLISAPYAWTLTTGSRDVVVAVLDTGLRDDHPDIDKSAIVAGRNLVSDQSSTNYRDNISSMSHGTMVTGIIGARTNNGTGVAGLNWNVSIMPVRVLSSSGGGSVAGVGQGIRWAVDNGADVINMSLAWDANSGDPGERFVVEQIEYAISRGVTLVAGAGNDNGRITMPAAHPDVIAVGAVDKNKRRAWYSNYGSELDLVAPGGSQQSSNSGGVLSTDVVSRQLSYSYQQGTSFASPHVAGVVALMYANGITDPHTVREILLDTAEDLGTVGFDRYYGHGLINAYAAVAGITRQDALVGVAETDGAVVGPVQPEPVGDERIAVVESVAPGNQTVFAWIDVTDNGILDAGDFAGIANVQVPQAGTVPVALDLYVFDTLPSSDQQRLLDIVNRQ